MRARHDLEKKMLVKTPFFIHTHYGQQCRQMVKRVCGKRTDDTHSVAHMERVVGTTMDILKHDFAGRSGDFWAVTIVGAWTHDVRERKYPDEHNEEELLKFLKNLNMSKDLKMDYTTYILKITDHVSFSKENAAILSGSPLNFKQILCDENFIDADDCRHIISDADKIDAIGEEGLSRVIGTAKHLYVRKHGQEPDRETLKKLVNDHAEEKLLKLRTFMRTSHGKKLAEEAHNVFVKALKKFNGNE
jgi:hypothetical protein